MRKAYLDAMHRHYENVFWPFMGIAKKDAEAMIKIGPKGPKVANA